MHELWYIEGTCIFYILKTLFYTLMKHILLKNFLGYSHMWAREIIAAKIRLEWLYYADLSDMLELILFNSNILHASLVLSDVYNIKFHVWIWNEDKAKSGKQCVRFATSPRDHPSHKNTSDTFWPKSRKIHFDIILDWAVATWHFISKWWR